MPFLLYTNNLLGQFHCLDAIGCIGVGAAAVGVVLSDGGAADHDFGACAGAAQFVDDFIDLRHGRRHQGGEADDVGILLEGGLNDGIGLDVLAEIDDLEAGVCEQCARDVLAEVVDVAFDGGDDEGALIGFGTRGDELLELVERRAHRLG